MPDELKRLAGALRARSTVDADVGNGLTLRRMYVVSVDTAPSPDVVTLSVGSGTADRAYGASLVTGLSAGAVVNVLTDGASFLVLGISVG